MVWFIGGTAALIAVPLLAVLGSPVLWALLPFLAAALAAIWWALERSYRDAEILEELTLTPDRITLLRRGPRGKRQEWEANPHWVEVRIYPKAGPKAGPVPDYLTLRGNGREVELGAFLTEEERRQLREEIQEALTALRSAQV